MANYETLNRLFLPRMLCTGLIMVTGCMLGFAWFGRGAPYDPVSVAIVFVGALIARCLLVPRTQHAAAAGAQPETVRG